MMKKIPALFSAFRAGQHALAAPQTRSLARVLAVSGVCAIALVGCNSLPGGGSSSSLGPGGGDGINDAALGVAASPRVTDQQVNLPRGGGRAQVGRPYRIAGRLYTPREDPNYDRTGVASWYGDAFHGRLTANGEVYDMHTLSAAHPTLPLPSYVRVTNLTNNRSVMVRVNDRGPFSDNRIIDLSKRAADVLDMRNDGIARVRVEYESPAPLHGQDVAWLEASATINGVPMNGGDPGVMFARAPVPVPAPVAAPVQAAFVSTTTAPVPRQQPQSFLGNLFGQPAAPVQSVSQPVTPGVQSAPSPNAPSLSAPSLNAPIDLSPPGGVQASVPAQQFVPSAARAPSAGLVPSAPIPSGMVGFMPVDLETGFTQRNQSALAQAGRIELAHRAASTNALDAATQMALQSRTVASLRETNIRAGTTHLALQPVETQPAGRTALVQIGIFGDPANVARVRDQLSSFGQVVTSEVRSGSRTLTQVRLRASVPSAQAEQDLLRTLARQGYTDAYITRT